MKDAESIDLATMLRHDAAAQVDPAARDRLKRAVAEIQAQQMRIAILEAQNAQILPGSRHELQANGEHGAPCARHCEARAFTIEIRQLKAERDRLARRLSRQEK